ncbi:MAG: VOC family protein [Chloroflexi bacterium]|nr:VOC family protein [Chloroflexota bacterium]
MGQPVVHWEIAATDARKLGDFYANLFDWQINANNPWGYGEVKTGGQGGIDGGIFQKPADNPAYVTFYVGVDDLPGYLEKAERLGGKTVLPPTPVPGVGAVAMFLDPEGNCIGLFKGA